MEQVYTVEVNVNLLWFYGFVGTIIKIYKKLENMYDILRIFIYFYLLYFGLPKQFTANTVDDLRIRIVLV